MPTEIQYENNNSVLAEIRTKIEKLETIGINTEPVRDAVAVIEENQSISKEKREEDLKIILSLLDNQWEIFFKIDSVTKNLSKALKNTYDIKTSEPFQLVKELLNYIKTIPNLNSKQNKKLTEALYPMIYNYMKLEVVCLKETPLLELIKNDPVHRNYIIPLLKEDIRNLPDSDQEKALEMEYELFKNGYDSSLLINKEMIQIIVHSSNEDFIKQQRTNIELDYINYEKVFSNTKDYIEVLKSDEKKYNSAVKTKNNYIKKILIRLGIVGVNLFLIGKLNPMIRKYIEGTTYYNILTTTYDSSNDYQILTLGIGTDDADSVVVKEIEPWIQTEKDVFKRKITTYQEEQKDTSTVNLKDYLTDYKTNDFTIEFEMHNGQPADYEENQETKYLVISKQVDSKLNNTDEDEFGYTVSIALIDGIILATKFLLLYGLTQQSLLGLISKYRGYKNLAASRKRDLEETKRETDTYLQECTDLFNDLVENPRFCLMKDYEKIKEESEKVLIR